MRPARVRGEWPDCRPTVGQVRSGSPGRGESDESPSGAGRSSAQRRCRTPGSPPRDRSVLRKRPPHDNRHRPGDHLASHRSARSGLDGAAGDRPTTCRKRGRSSPRQPVPPVGDTSRPRHRLVLRSHRRHLRRRASDSRLDDRPARPPRRRSTRQAPDCKTRSSASRRARRSDRARAQEALSIDWRVSANEA